MTALLGMVHGGVEIVEEAVLEELVVDEVELTPRVVVRLVVADSREVEPLGVPELVACSQPERRVHVVCIVIHTAHYIQSSYGEHMY